MKLLSVNIGHPRRNHWRTAELTGIDKRPVTGPVAVTSPGPMGDGSVGLAGDRVYDVGNHGGTDQAVYAYAREDLDHWEGVLGRTLPNGVFGENLTTEGLDVNEALIGERWRVGPEVVLEVTRPRIPCSTFQGWLDRQGWMKEFTGAALPGPYFRVITPGEFRAGDDVEVIARPDHDVSVALTFRALTLEPALLPRLLEAEALAGAVRERVVRRLAGRTG
ncbi:MOSC domain-containing protein [Kineosporia sp. J2-2]|uniref:MOSC domain-containing protein n=1 Tax=Kineosporia corallincola TaxID=2835133 RepID=A0ABS5TPH5_9ACTN|nr:MOSC domain-containing protein [Kineosporia corallincola]MBT0773000.1 MOSC domain-containing protein [Kineosporia corallincola]